MCSRHLPSIHWAPFGDVWCQISGVTQSFLHDLHLVYFYGWHRPLRRRHVAVPPQASLPLSLRNAVITMTTLWLCAITTFVALIFTTANFVYYQYTTEVNCALLLCIITALYIIVFTAFRIYKSLNNSQTLRGDAKRKALSKWVVSAVAIVVCWVTSYVTLVVMTCFLPALKLPALLQFWSLYLANYNSFMNVFVYSFTNQFRQKSFCSSSLV